MARQFGALILTAFALSASLQAEDNAPAPKKPETPPPLGLRRPGQGPRAPEFGNVRRALDALTPEQRQRFVENLKRWANLPPEEKKALADRDGFRRKKMAEEIDRAVAETGLNLEGDRRALFAKRYDEERRKVEEQLRKELDEKRQPLIKDIVARLKAEFSAEAATPK